MPPITPGTPTEKRLGVVNFTFALAFALVVGVSAGATSDQATEQRLRIDQAAELEGAAQKRLVALRDSEQAWAFDDLIERGRIAIATGDIRGACVAFEMAVPAATDVEARFSARYLWAATLLQSAHVARSDSPDPDLRTMRQITLAAETMNDLQLIAPLSRDIAIARVMAWSMLENEAETLAAEHQLRVIDPTMEGTARSSVSDVARVVLAICEVGRVVLEQIELDGIIAPETRVLLLRSLDQGSAAATLALRFANSGDQ